MSSLLSLVGLSKFKTYLFFCRLECGVTLMYISKSVTILQYSVVIMGQFCHKSICTTLSLVAIPPQGYVTLVQANLTMFELMTSNESYIRLCCIRMAL